MHLQKDGCPAASDHLLVFDADWDRASRIARDAGLAAGDPTIQSLAEARAANYAYNLFWNVALPPVRDSHDVCLEGPAGPFRLRIMHPRNTVRWTPRPVVLYFHGGGFVFNSVETHERTMRLLCRRAGATVIGVGYHLAPEHRYPCQLDEAEQALEWVIASAETLDIDPRRIALAGDSAGATLALSLALRLRDRERTEAINHCLLFYGMFSMRLDTRSHRAFGHPPFGLTSSKVDWFWRAYLPDSRVAADPLAVPWRADLYDLPEIHLVAAEYDCLYDDTLDLHERLLAAHVPTTLSVAAGLPHSFLQQSAFVAAADAALGEAADRAAISFQRNSS